MEATEPITEARTSLWTGRLQYDLPPQLIAQQPAVQRTKARLMVVDRNKRTIDHATFEAIGTWLRPGDLLIANDSRVEAARLVARRASGGRVEVLLLSFADGALSAAMINSSKTPKHGETLYFEGGIEAEVASPVVGGRTNLRFIGRTPSDVVAAIGSVPLPPYIHREDGPTPHDTDRYQTVYAKKGGSVAAPTAGLHFSEDLIGELQEGGVDFATLTLNVGPGTFQPIRGSLQDHRMESEHCDVDAGLVDRWRRARRSGGRIVAVGTTSVRALESAAAGIRTLQAYSGSTDLFIQPGHDFYAVDALVTNFHLPGSTLLSLVMAFAGESLTRTAYETAIDCGYRFYSYGDAMLVV